MELLKFSLHRRALRYQRACFTSWREEVERTKIQNKRLKSKVEGLRLRYLRAAFDRWRKERMSGKRLKERLARATSRRAMKLQREMFEGWRMEAREKRKEREESRDVEREVKELNERMEALQKQFEKEKEQWKEEETRIANAHEAKLEEFTKANENEKLRVATERASRDAETKQKFEAEIALLKLKEEQGRKTYEERKERLIEAVGAMEKEKKERLARKFFTKWREQTMEAKRWKRTLRFLLLKKRRSVIESAFREWKEATETSREERERIERWNAVWKITFERNGFGCKNESLKTFLSENMREGKVTRGKRLLLETRSCKRKRSNRCERTLSVRRLLPTYRRGDIAHVLQESCQSVLYLAKRNPNARSRESKES